MDKDQKRKRITYFDDGYIFIMDSDDPREIIDEIIATNYPYESCFALCFEKEFLSRLLQEGFLLMSYKDNAAGIYILEARHHSTLNVLFFDAIHIPARVKSLLPKYELRFGVEFDTIIDKCIEKHGDAWLTAPLVNAFKEIRRLGDPALTFSSFGLYCNGRLVAGDFGSITGRIYTSYSGYYDENNAGTVQMIHTAHYLRDNGYAFWNLGMPLSYKSRLGAPTLSLEKFIPLWRKHVCQTPLPTLDYERMPAEYR